MQLGIHFLDNVQPQRTWQLDPSLLLCTEFKKFVTEQIDFFLETNDCSNIRRRVLWEIHKAYIRGQIISYTAHQNKQRNKGLSEIEQSILDIDKKCSTSPTSELLKERILLQMKFNNLSTHQAVRNLLKTKQKLYKHREKAGRPFTHQLLQITSNSQITEINIGPGVTKCDPKLKQSVQKILFRSIYIEHRCKHMYNKIFSRLSRCPHS